MKKESSSDEQNIDEFADGPLGRNEMEETPPLKKNLSSIPKKEEQGRLFEIKSQRTNLYHQLDQEVQGFKDMLDISKLYNQTQGPEPRKIGVDEKSNQ